MNPEGDNVKDALAVLEEGTGNVLPRPFLFLFGLLWLLTYILFPSWMLPGPQWVSAVALSCLVVFLSVNLWLFHRWRLDEQVSWHWPVHPRAMRAIAVDHAGLFSGLFLLTILHVYPLVVAPIGAGDAPGLALTGPNLLSPLWAISARLGVSVSWIRLLTLGLGLLSLWLVGKGLFWTFSESCRSTLRRSRAFLIVSLAGLLLLGAYAWGGSSLFIIDGLVDPPITFHREPPISRFLLVGSTLLFGVNEVAVRLPQLLFMLGAILYLYRLVALYRNSQVALLSAFTFGMLPPVFAYTHSVFFEAGLLFFVIVASFYFLRHLRDGVGSDLLVGMLLTNAGFLYKRPALLVLGVFAVYAILLCLYHRRWVLPLPARDYARSVWICLAGVLPWLIIVGSFAGPGRFLRHRYDLIPSNWLSLDLATGYLQQLPLQLSWPIVILVIFSLVSALLIHRDALFGYTVTWFAIYYVFFTFDSCTHCIGHDRFALVMFPPLAIWIGQFMQGTDWLRKIRQVSIACSVILLVYLGLVSTVVRMPLLNPQYASYLDARGDIPPPSEILGYWKENLNSFNVGTRYLPYDLVYAYFHQHPRRGDKILVWDQQQMQLSSYKYELRLNLYECSDTADYNQCQFGTKEQLGRFCRDNQISYVLIPVGYDYLGDSLTQQYFSPPLSQAFDEGNFKPFGLVQRFEHGVNALLLLQVPTDEVLGDRL